MRYFSAQETKWLQELDGIELAGFRQRAFAFLMDITLATLALWAVMLTVATTAYVVARFAMHNACARFHIGNGEGDSEHHVMRSIIAPILYFGLLTWRGKGQSPGKRWMGIRVVSLMHRKLSLWHSIERALGYAAAALEGGFGFMQFFIHPYRRTVQDRIGETIVVTEKAYQAMRSRQAGASEMEAVVETGDGEGVQSAAEASPSL